MIDDQVFFLFVYRMLKFVFTYLSLFLHSSALPKTVQKGFSQILSIILIRYTTLDLSSGANLMATTPL